MLGNAADFQTRGHTDGTAGASFLNHLRIDLQVGKVCEWFCSTHRSKSVKAP